MAVYETVIRTPQGKEEVRRVSASTTQEAKRLFEQMYGGPRAVPFLPRQVSS